MVDHERRLLANAERLLVDGNNLVGGRDEVRLGALESALRRLVSSRVKIEVFRDGGATSADDQIIAALGRPDPGRADRLVVVSDDRELRDRARRVGAGVVSARLFREMLAGPSSGTSSGALIGPSKNGPKRAAPTLGRPSVPYVEPGKDDGPVERRWQPGRGATRKRGPSARRPRGR
ncbi:MAG: hypothetical protein ACR2JL_02630 [Candidatus Limnocylindrus sp.]|jgi:hypothetical protein